jgi:hypothetical protein
MPSPAPVIATTFPAASGCLGWQYSSSLASACSHAARLPHGEVSGRHPDGVIELRLLPPGFTELGFTGFDLMPSRDQIRAVAQDVVPALRAAGTRAAAAATPVAGRRASDPPPGVLAAPGNRHLTSRPGTRSHPRCLLAGTARAPYTDWRKVPVQAPRSRQRAPPAGQRTTPMV